LKVSHATWLVKCFLTTDVKCIPATDEGAPYLAFFWRDVGVNECWR
jgi:hypothetical protein